MKHIDNKMILGIAVVVAMTFSMIVTPVTAATVTIKEETFERVFEADENGHAYIYSDPKMFDTIYYDYLSLDEDIDYERYEYDSIGWFRNTGTYPSPGENEINWHNHETFSSAGIWGDSHILPTFYDFEREFNTTAKRQSFSLTMGQESTIAVESDILYIGILPIGGAEFVHFTVESLQDDCEWEMVIFDSEGHFISYGGGIDGDITVTPFKPGTGVHYVWFGAGSSLPGAMMFTLHPQGVTPQTIALGNVVRGTLTSSELSIVDGSVVHTEKAPTVNTYKVRSPDGPASISFSFNYPEMLPLVPPQPVAITFTSNIYLPSYDGYRFMDGFVNPTSDTFYYRSCQGEPYYITVMGGDNVKYALYNALVEDSELPLNEEFLLQNLHSDTAYRGFGLTIEEDSFMRINSTIISGSCSWNVYTVDENMTLRPFTLGYATSFQNSPFIYMPAGDYVLYATMDGNYLGEFEFNIGPITEDPSASINRIGGFRVPTNALDRHNFTLLMSNQDNVTVRTQWQIFDSSGGSIVSDTIYLANRWDGTHWMPHPTYDNFTFYPFSNYLTNDYSVICVSPYRVDNNTAGATNQYVNYTVDYTISLNAYTEDFYDGMAVLNVGSGATHRFDLPLPGGSSESYWLELNLTAGVWYNVSVVMNDVNAFSAELLHVIGVLAHETTWDYLDDNLVGSIGAGLSFEFGAMTGNPVLTFSVNRPLSSEGNLTITIDPLLTNHLGEIADPTAQIDVLGLLGSVVPVVVIGGAVIVVVYIVYIKKLKK
jgi:hypothetical protein